MKIGFDDTPAAPAGTYSRHLAELLAEYAPEHEYIADGKRYREFDLYHGFRPGLPLPVLLRKVPRVVTVSNLNFLRYPHLYSLPERLVLLRLYRRALRSASRLITVNRSAREELSERLRIDPGRIEVVLPLAVRVPQRPPADAQLEAVRRKYMLPAKFVLMLGTVEPRHNHEVLFEAVYSLGERERAVRAEGLCAAGRDVGDAGPELPGMAAGRLRQRDDAPSARQDGAAPDGRSGVSEDSATRDGGRAEGAPLRPGATNGDGLSVGRAGIVVCGRRTSYSDSLLEYARERHMAARVDFIYEITPDDLPALFRLAHAFVYLPDAGIEASIVPVVEAMRAGVPMVLSDTQLNREAAGDAAAYVRPEAAGEVAAALENVLADTNFRREMQARERRRAVLFSEYAVAKRLTDIYTSL